MKSAASSDRITKENRPQYFDTTIVATSDADLEITQAEARGRQRQTAEEALKQTIKRVAWVVSALLFCAIVAVAWKMRLH